MSSLPTCLRCMMPWQRLRPDIASILLGSQRRRLWARLLIHIATTAGRHWRERGERWWRRNGARRIFSRAGGRLARSSLILLRHWVRCRLVTGMAGCWLAITTAVWTRFCAAKQQLMYTTADARAHDFFFQTSGNWQDFSSIPVQSIITKNFPIQFSSKNLTSNSAYHFLFPNSIIIPLSN